MASSTALYSESPADQNVRTQQRLAQVREYLDTPERNQVPSADVIQLFFHSFPPVRYPGIQRTELLPYLRFVAREAPALSRRLS